MVFLAYVALFISLVLGVVGYGGVIQEPSSLIRGMFVVFLLLFVVTASHPFLDAMTDGGEGIAFFSPFSNHRYFFPYRPIMVSPLGVGAFFGLRGLLVLANEFLLVIRA